MTYKSIITGRFLVRLNRFVGQVDIDGQVETVHIKNTGRCKELLVPGNIVYLATAENPSRKTKYDLIAVEKDSSKSPPTTVNVDSQIPNAVAAEWLPASGLFSQNATIRREVTYGRSRFDLYIEDGDRKAFMEVKGVTLEQDGVALFPDAPTERGVKHINELIDCKQAGYEAYILFVIQMKCVHTFCPNDYTHPAFGDALRKAANAGVQILAVDCNVAPDQITIDHPVNIQLERTV